MKKLFALVAMFAACVVAQAADKGLAVGEGVAPFYVTDVTGPSAGEKLCYRCRYGNKPTVSIFARKMTPEIADLTKGIDGVVSANSDKKMAAFVVLMTDKPEETEAALKTVAKEKGITKTPLTTFDGVAGPEEYKIAADSEVTVVMWVGGKVAASSSFKAGELTKDGVAATIKDTAKILN